MSPPLITVAVCTRNRAALLAGMLDALERLRVDPHATWEVLIIDNGSTDETDQVIEAFRRRLHLRAVHEPRAGVAHARNRALDEARGHWVLFTDDDARPACDWLTACVDAIERHPQAAAIGGAIDPYFLAPLDPDIARAFPMAASGFCGLDHAGEERPLAAPLPLFTANLAVRRDAATGLRFDARLGPRDGAAGVGEDTAFVDALRAAGGHIVWCPTMRVQHRVAPERVRLWEVARHQVGYSASLVVLRGAAVHTTLAPLRCVANLLISGVLRSAGRRAAALARLRSACHWWGVFVGTRRAVASAATTT